MLRVASVASLVVVVTIGTAHASSLAELSAAQGVQSAAVGRGTSSGMSVYGRARDTIQRRIPASGGSIGAWQNGCSTPGSSGKSTSTKAWATARAGGAGGWVSAKSGAGKTSGWARATKNGR
jgi:hypothetical protein